jgi:ribosomal small subunit protein bTHX
MGSGDARSRRGKLFRGSHGKTRPKGGRKKSGNPLQVQPPKPAARKTRTT